MKTFLQEVAETLLSRHGERISEVNMLFPTSRASLFFSDALSRIVEKPVWTPRTWSMTEVASRITGLAIVERPRLVAELYRIYSTQASVQFDSFYQWGCQLLADFDIIDQYMVDTGMLFANMDQLNEMNVNLEDYMSKDQIAVVRRFWGTLENESESGLKREFCSTWRRVAAVYVAFKSRLREQGIAYSGMAYRDAVEKIEGGYEPALPETWAVVGFNALSRCERKLLQFLRERCSAEFFWDYDSYYVSSRDQEAGDSIRLSLEQFGETAGIAHGHFAGDKAIDIVSCGSSVLQCQHAVSVLRDIARRNGTALDKRTAVVLCDETLLLPLLHALPEELGRPNVTMGYPVRSTLAYSLLDRLISLYLSVRRNGEFAFADVDGILRHPYVSGSVLVDVGALLGKLVEERRYTVPPSCFGGMDLLQDIFTLPGDDGIELIGHLAGILSRIACRAYDGVDARFRVEFLTVLSDCMTRHRNVLEKCGIPMSRRIGAMTLRRAVSDLRVPFVGEPLEGFQIMGMLETRCLDFDDVVILSASDDVFPGKRTSDSSFIPCALRKGYSLPSVEDEEAVYAYNFYRLIQRARSVTVMYSSHTDESDSGEPSRYVRQIEMETGKTVNHSAIGARIFIDPECEEVVRKTDVVMDALARYATPGCRTISPSTLFTYADCPMKFFFKAVAGIRSENTLDDDMESNTFGNITHASLENLYSRFKGMEVTAPMLQSLLPDVDDAVHRAVDAEYFKDPDATVHHALTPSLRIIVSEIANYIRTRVIPYDMTHDGFVLNDVEKSLDMEFRFGNDAGQRSVFLHGIADRIDDLGSCLRVVDYKTGNSQPVISSIEDLFCKVKLEHRQNFLNTLLYAMMIRDTMNRDVVPALYYLRYMGDGYEAAIYDRQLKRCGVPFSEYDSEFRTRLGSMLEEIFDPGIPFARCGNEDNCRNCDFAPICGRERKRD